jgi:cupin 2 domain-containing protein
VIELPVGLELARTTPDFDETTVPQGLLAPHQVAEGVWGRLVVLSGSLTFCFEDDVFAGRLLEAGDDQVIPPVRPHHLEIDGPVSLHVEFHRPPADDETD